MGRLGKPERDCQCGGISGFGFFLLPNRVHASPRLVVEPVETHSPLAVVPERSEWEGLDDDAKCPSGKMKMMNKVANAETSDSDWKSLYRVGGVAALIAGILFRRNIAAEIGLFSNQPSPVTVGGWFSLLQNNRLLGLTYLNIFDIVNYALVSLMFLALYAVLRRTNKSYMVIAVALGLVGIGVYFASNTAFSMLSLSDQYAVSTTDEQRTMLLSAGEALLAINRFTSFGAHPGSGGYMSLLLIAVAGMIISIVMLRSDVFNRTTAHVGILASAFDLAYCIVFVFMPAVDTELLAVIFIPAAGLFLMIWHIMVGWKLYLLGK